MRLSDLLKHVCYDNTSITYKVLKCLCIYRVLKLSHLKLTAPLSDRDVILPGTLKLGAGASPLGSNHLSGKRCHQDRDQVPTC